MSVIQSAIADSGLVSDTTTKTSWSFFGIGAVLCRLEQALNRQIQACRDAEVAHFIERNGGRLTDDLEREISRKYGQFR